MMFNLLLAIAMIYLVMAAVFESTLYPMSIITSIFMAIVGVMWFLFVTRTTVTFMALIGVQILIGVVVNIGIVLVAHINDLRAAGMERMEAIVQAGTDRLRPILMTTLTASLGLLPLAACRCARSPWAAPGRPTRRWRARSWAGCCSAR